MSSIPQWHQGLLPGQVQQVHSVIMEETARFKHKNSG